MSEYVPELGETWETIGVGPVTLKQGPGITWRALSNKGSHITDFLPGSKVSCSSNGRPYDDMSQYNLSYRISPAPGAIMTKPDPTAVFAAVDAMTSLCTKGRAEVKALVATMLGVEAPKPVPKQKSGQIWRQANGQLVIISRDNIVYLRNGDTDSLHTPTNFTYVAESLAAYLAAGGKL